MIVIQTLNRPPLTKVTRTPAKSPGNLLGETLLVPSGKEGELSRLIDLVSVLTKVVLGHETVLLVVRHTRDNGRRPDAVAPYTCAQAHTKALLPRFHGIRHDL